MNSNPMSLSLIRVLDMFDRLGITIGDFVLELLTSNGHEHPAVESIFGNLEKILEALIGQSDRTQQIIDRWSSENTKKFLQDEMCKLTLKETGFHFSARTTTETKLKDFDVQAMSNKMQSLAPGLCALFDVLLEANPALSYKRNWARRKAEASGLSRQQKRNARKATDGDINMEDVTSSRENESVIGDREYWNLFDLQEISLIDDEDDEPEGMEAVVDEQQSKLKAIVRSFESMHLPYVLDLFSMAETCCLLEHSDAEYQSLLQYTSDCFGHFFAFLWRTGDSQRVTGTYGALDLNNFN